VLTPADGEYDQARRIWNGAVSRYPAVIARCADEADVVAAVRVAREAGLPLSVRGGGHDWSARAIRDGGVVIDLTAMREVTVDPVAGTAVAQGGALAGDLAAAADRYGLAPVTGTSKAVGLTMAGGYGLLSGSHGLALDNLLGARLVLASGEIATASPDADPDLYWALRGGGGNFGVVVQARYQLHPVGPLLAGPVLFPLAQAPAVLRGYADLVAAAPDELTIMAGVLCDPAGEPLLLVLPAASGGGGAGPGGRAGALARQVLRLGRPVAAELGPKSYQELIATFDPYVVNGRHNEMRTRWLGRLDEGAAQVLTTAAARMTSPFSAVILHHCHGRATETPVADTAFALRRDHLLVEILASWAGVRGDAGAVHRHWARELSGDLARYALPGGYPNLLGPDESGRALTAFGPNLARLLDLKDRYDPDRVFSAVPGLAAPPAGRRAPLTPNDTR
jgi:FAD/FMN-containing dehydrogenase